MQDLDASVDCDGTCSSLSTVGSRLVSHDEVERQFDDAIRRLPSPGYVRFMNHLQDHYPRTYRIIRKMGF